MLKYTLFYQEEKTDMKKIIALLLTFTMIMPLAGCAAGAAGAAPAAAAPEAGAAPADSASDVEYIKGKGTLIVGITDFAPMDYKSDEGEWIGFDADIARKVAESLGVEVSFVEIDWDNKILELDNKSIDCVWNGMTLTDEVKAAMNCTDPYCKNAQVVVIKVDKAADYPDEASLASLNFAVEAGSAGEAVAQEKGWNVTSLTSQADALMEVEAGTSDAAIIDLLMAGAMIGEGTSYTDLTHTVELTEEEYGIGCRKDSDLTAYINDELTKLYKDGTIENTAKEYGLQYALITR